MNDPALYTEPDQWADLGQVKNTLKYVREGSPVGLVQSKDGQATMEVFAVIVPIEQYRQMVRVEPA